MIGGPMSQFLDTLAHRVLIYDGAMGTNIQRYQLTVQDYGGQTTEGCNEYLVLTKPSVIEEIHTGFRLAIQQVGLIVPLQAQVSLDTSGRMLLGTDIAAVMTTLVVLRVDVVGLNCSTGPEHMREPVRFLSENCPLPISTIPNAGIPLNVNGLAVYPMEPEPMAAALRDFITEFGVNIIGGCCGSSHEHLQAIVKACRHAPRRPRPIADNNLHNKNFTHIILPFVSSGIRATALQQDPPPLLVGERVNSQGSRKAKQALLNEAYDTLLGIGREQVEGGAHILDVCVALTERKDEAEQMAKTIKKLSIGVEAPLMIDSTEPDVMKAALETYPGRTI